MVHKVMLRDLIVKTYRPKIFEVIFTGTHGLKGRFQLRLRGQIERRWTKILVSFQKEC